MKKIIFYILICFSLFSCKTKTAEIPKDVFAADIDTTVNPADDFFDYANGKWIKDNPIPSDESAWGIGYIVNLENQKRLREISKEAAKEGGIKDSASQKIGDFWYAAMDSATIEQQGTQYLQPYFEKINSIKDIPSFIKIVADLDNIGVNTLFSYGVSQDDKKSDEMAFRLNQGGLGLPDRDYYFNKDSSTANIRKAYVAHIIKILEFLEHDSISASKAAANILKLETSLAKVSRKLADLSDPYANYHKMAIPGLKKLSSFIDWETFLKNIGVTKIDSVIVGQPEFFKSLDGILKSTSIKDWKDYLIYHLVNAFSNALPEKYGIESFNFEKLFSGAKVRKPRWKRVIQSEQGAMGELLGQLYVKKYFDSTAKQRYVKMAEAIRSAYKDRIEKLTWMSDSTKQKALIKLAAIKKKIGYPDKWKDFSAMEISRESYVQNEINSRIWWHNFEMNKLGKPVDRDEWDMYPQTYNAYYDPGNNEIVFPAAAFIVPGYADKDLDDATMYGYVGASYIGHEITHGFDDQGRLYDANGNLHNWWTKNDSAEFAKRAAVIIKQFDQYEPLPGVHINGRATQGENIADLGGLEIGIDAFKKSDAYKENKIIGGFTPMQRFFLGYALSWLYETRPESLKTQLMTDVHSPAKYRVNGPFSNIDEFYKTFNVKPGDKMYRADSVRVRIW
ncbi:MAG TPA: M13 family metallopeptidase [Hanamia sp.]|nr:M13 family metallopeptidase [Hanamia sp.]